MTTILTESWAILLTVAFGLAVTLALKIGHRWKSFAWWLAAGLIGGAVTMFRPDCALFVGAAGVMLIVVGLVVLLAYYGHHMQVLSRAAR